MTSGDPEAHAKFTETVRQQHQALCERGFEPNEAAALALKVAGGVAQPALPPGELAAAVAAGEEDGALEAARRVFSSLDTLYMTFADFTPHAPPALEEGPGCGLPGTKSKAARLRQAGLAAQMQVPLKLTTIQAAYSELLALHSDDIDGVIARGCHRLCAQLSHSVLSVARSGVLLGTEPFYLQALLACPLLEEIEHAQLVLQLVNTVMSWPTAVHEVLVDAFTQYDRAYMARTVQLLQQFITVRLFEQSEIDQGVENATRMLAILHRANAVSGALAAGAFYNEAVNNDDFNVREDYRRWKAPGNGFCFCRYPFIYDAAAKARILKLENLQDQITELQDAVFNYQWLGGPFPFLFLRVRRGPTLINDTIIQLQRAFRHDSLKKPLKVQFLGEDGVDEGGVQKEFFQLVVRAIFDPNYGMFTHDTTRQHYWFRPSRMDMEQEFELVGILLGLAIYNSHMLEVAFPPVTYKKLQRERTDLDDLADVHPEVHSNLAKLLEYPGDVVDLDLVFQVNQEIDFGEIEAVDLKPGGGSIAVDDGNREEYVRLYTEFLLDRSIERQFASFRAGFLKLCDGPPLKMFLPEELELLICGGQELDFYELQRATIYDDGFTAESQAVEWFWQAVHALSHEDKKRLLFFVSGSDRVPIKGLGNLHPRFVISRNGPHSERLPTAHTCFNHLLLPDYNSKEVLSERLATAILNAEGFGLI